MTISARFSRLGFDPPRLAFALRTALAACLALLMAWAIGLEHPQWSAMTVWAASQPLRGQLLEKSFFRFAGTVSGTLAGVVLMVLSRGQPALLVAGLAVWIALCAGIGNLQRSFVAYGTMLAGYSAAMVALLDTGHPDHVFALGADRLLTVLVGVATALAVGALFAPAGGGAEVAGRVRRLCAHVLRAMAERLAGQPVDPAGAPRAVLSEMAAIDETLDPHAAGSLRSRRAVRVLRTLLAAQVSALLWLRGDEDAAPDAGLSALLLAGADALEAGAPAGDVLAPLERAAGAASGRPALREAIARLEAALADQLGAEDAAERPRVSPPLVLHRDWVGAREALLRAGITMLAVGAIWLATGWSGGPYMLLGTAIMISLFSTFDEPALTMRAVLAGQVAGAAGAVACRWLLWPHAGAEWQLVVMMMPFVLVGVLPMGHRRAMAAAFDYNMVVLLLLQPHLPLSGTFGHSLAMAGAVAAAPLAGLLAYRFVFPVDARRRRDTLIAMMVRELQAMAATPDAAKHRRIWRARLYHRLLRLVRWMEKTGAADLSATDGSLAVMRLGSAILRLQELRREPGLAPATARRLDGALARMRTVAADPERARRALARAAAWLSQEARPEAALIGEAAAGLSANMAFFRRAAG